MIKNLLRWARITGPGADDKQFPTQQMEYLGKVADGVMLFPYGYHGNVPDDFLALIAAVQGNPDNRVAIGVLPKNRPTLAAGEVAFYHPPTDAFIIWRSSGELDIETGSGGTKDINITAANVNITGNLDVSGTFNCDGNATLGGSGGADIARKGDAVAGGVITGGSANHKAT